MVFDHNMQATHCAEPTSAARHWFSPRGDRWWQVWACRGHLEGLTGIREFGSRRSA
jgi:hypothetical protein